VVVGLQANIFKATEVHNNIKEIQQPLRPFTILLCKLFGFFICHIPLLGKILAHYKSEGITLSAVTIGQKFKVNWALGQTTCWQNVSHILRTCGAETLQRNLTDQLRSH